jgi:hypothetical protein
MSYLRVGTSGMREDIAKGGENIMYSFMKMEK